MQSPQIPDFWQLLLHLLRQGCRGPALLSGFGDRASQKHGPQLQPLPSHSPGQPLLCFWGTQSKIPGPHSASRPLLRNCSCGASPRHLQHRTSRQVREQAGEQRGGLPRGNGFPKRGRRPALLTPVVFRSPITCAHEENIQRVSYLHF